MNAVTYKNRDVFISVVAWMFILYGAYGGYTSLGQLILTVSFFPSPAIPVYVVTIFAVGLLFSAVSLWCGLGLRKRSRSALKTLIVFLWPYIVWSVGQNISPERIGLQGRSGAFVRLSSRGTARGQTIGDSGPPSRLWIVPGIRRCPCFNDRDSDSASSNVRSFSPQEMGNEPNQSR